MVVLNRDVLGPGPAAQFLLGWGFITSMSSLESLGRLWPSQALSPILTMGKIKKVVVKVMIVGLENQEWHPCVMGPAVYVKICGCPYP